MYFKKGFKILLSGSNNFLPKLFLRAKEKLEELLYSLFWLAWSWDHLFHINIQYEFVIIVKITNDMRWRFW